MPKNKSTLPSVPSPLRQVMTLPTEQQAPTASFFYNKRKRPAEDHARKSRQRTAAPTTPNALRLKQGPALRALNNYHFDEAFELCSKIIASTGNNLTILAMRIIACAFDDCLINVRQDLVTIRSITKDDNDKANCASTIRTTIERLYTEVKPRLPRETASCIQANATKTLLQVQAELVYAGTSQSKAQYNQLCQSAKQALQAEKFDVAIQLATEAYTLKPKEPLGLIIRNTARMCAQQIPPASEDLEQILKLSQEKAHVAEIIQGNDYKAFEQRCMNNILNFTTAFRRTHTQRLAQKKGAKQANSAGSIRPTHRMSP